MSALKAALHRVHALRQKMESQLDQLAELETSLIMNIQEEHDGAGTSIDTHVTFDREKATKLHAAFTKAVKAKQEQFTFDGNDFYVPYAKYLLEYLSQQLGVTFPAVNARD